MRIGVLADIHGNLIALDAVLADLAREPVDQLICLGDVAALGPQPHEVIARLRDLDCPVIMGNTDAWMLTPPSLEHPDPETRVIRVISHWCARQLTPDDRDYLRTFPPFIERTLSPDGTMLCYHGSPRSFDDIIAAVTPDHEVERMLDGQSASIMVGGHTHIQMVRRYEDAHLVNVGSIGLPGVNAGGAELPDNRKVHWAEYGVLSLTDGRLNIDLRRIPLDVAALFQQVRASDMPHQDWWMERWSLE